MKKSVLQTMMDIDAATNSVNEERLLLEDKTNDYCRSEFIDIVPLTSNFYDPFTTECAGGNWSAEDVQEENLAVVKQEPDDV